MSVLPGLYVSVSHGHVSILDVVRPAAWILLCVSSSDDPLLNDPLLFSSDSDEKPLKGSPRSLTRAMPATESADSLVQYGDGDHGLFSEDGSFIGAYAGSKEKGSVDSNGSSAATFPLRA